jgi:pimeloyl-ACP methyl ester carboxylesterase
MRHVYLHGFASGPTSRKARFFQNAFAKKGIHLDVPALDLGDFEHLTVSGQLAALDSLLAGAPARLLGSSMGGYLSALYATSHPEIERMVLLAPAFDFVDLLERSNPPQQLAAWRDSGWTNVFHHSTGGTRRLHYGLMHDARRYPAMPEFLQPALIFHGTADDVVPISLSRALAEKQPNVELIELPSSHELLDVLDQIAARAIPFLTSAHSPS